MATIATWSRFPSHIKDVEILQNILTRKQIWRLRYSYRGREIISKWREDSAPKTEEELEAKLKAKPHFYTGG